MDIRGRYVDARPTPSHQSAWQSLYFPDGQALENPGADAPWGQVDLTPEAKIGLTPLPKIKMTPVDIEPAGDFICIFGFRSGRRGI